ncbi:MinD/ParA family ATP-binding protein, partial [Mycobacteroides chelonae]|uniref:MinD/ParA family ATP-binding protein n=1 Tax=Mycobacteroides chelonae TaxID=1774 RepID=UPI001A9779FE
RPGIPQPQRLDAPLQRLEAQPQSAPSGLRPPWETQPRPESSAADFTPSTQSFGPPGTSSAQAPTPTPVARQFEPREFSQDRPDSELFGLDRYRSEGPQQGIRAVLHRFHIPIGKSQSEIEYDKDIARMNKSMRYAKVIGVGNLKGGVGKTTSAISFGSTLAQHRAQGKVVAIDAASNGTLDQRVSNEERKYSDIRRFANDPNLGEINEIESHLLSNHHGLSVLGSGDPLDDNKLTPEEYLKTLERLKKYYRFIIVDLDNSAANLVFETAMKSLDALLIVSSTARGGAAAAKDTLGWVRQHQMHELYSRSFVLMNSQTPAKPSLNVAQTISHFVNNEKRPVIEVAWDEHLAEDGPVNLDLIDKGTRRSFEVAVAKVVSSLPGT